MIMIIRIVDVVELVDEWITRDKELQSEIWTPTDLPREKPREFASTTEPPTVSAPETR